MKEYQLTNTRRNNEIKKLRAEKKSFEEIASKYGLTRQRIQQICKVLDKSKK